MSYKTTIHLDSSTRDDLAAMKPGHLTWDEFLRKHILEEPVDDLSQINHRLERIEANMADLQHNSNR